MSEITPTNKPDIVQQMRQRLHKRNPRATTGLLLDVSYSMNGDPINKMRALAEGLRQFRTFTFSDRCRELMPNEAVGEVEAGTKMHTAFAHVKASGIVHCVIITDGQPDDEGAALTQAMGLQVDVLYVGPAPAPPFLEKLANATGGKYGQASLDALKELETRVRGLLPAPPETIQL